MKAITGKNKRGDMGSYGKNKRGILEGGKEKLGFVWVVVRAHVYLSCEKENWWPQGSNLGSASVTHTKSRVEP